MMNFPPSSASSQFLGDRPVAHRIRRGLARTLTLAAAVMAGWAGLAKAASAQATDPLPSDIQALIQQMDQAASAEDLDTVMEGVSRTFRHADGLTYDTLEQALETFWSRYDNLTYSTTVNSWAQDGSAIVVQSTTEVTGTQDLDGRTLQLTATLTSEQRFENGQLAYQATLAEQTQVTSGDVPPAVIVSLPETVAIGQNYYFDMVVQEPLGDRRLLGTAIAEPVEADGYLADAELEMELLSAGGLFKVGRAPALPEQNWISGVIIHEDGITMVTRRIRFENR